MSKNCVISISGGMDSSTLLLRALKEYDEVTAISFDYGQKHKVELERAVSLVQYLNSHLEDGKNWKMKDGVATPPYRPIRHRIINLDGLSDLLHSTLVTGGEEVPEGHYEQENMKDTVVPNRNKIFASIVQAVALSVAERTGKPTDIALGIHAGDHAIYPDCRQEFRDADDQAFRIGNWGAEKVHYFTPYIDTDKLGILQDGELLCQEFGLGFDEVYRRTLTSYKPIWIKHPWQLSLEEVRSGDIGEWYSDIYSGSSVERVLAFIELGRPDPVPYATQDGPVEWEFVKQEVQRVVEEYKNK